MVLQMQQFMRFGVNANQQSDLLRAGGATPLLVAVQSLIAVKAYPPALFKYIV